MRIRYLGAVTTRMIGPVTWTQTDRVQEVIDAGLAAEILTQPGESFEVDAADPLRAQLGLSADMAARLVVLAGVIDMTDLAALDALGAEAVAEAVGVSVDMVRDWQAQLKAASEPGWLSRLKHFPIPTTEEDER